MEDGQADGGFEGMVALKGIDGFHHRQGHHQCGLRRGGIEVQQLSSKRFEAG